MKKEDNNDRNVVDKIVNVILLSIFILSIIIQIYAVVFNEGHDFTFYLLMSLFALIKIYKRYKEKRKDDDLALLAVFFLNFTIIFIWQILITLSISK